jgi:F-type H+/Na+-transporting ATPase subunit beta
MQATAPKTNSQPGHGTGKGVGRVTQVIGSTFDVEFSEDALPAIYNALKVKSDYKGIHLDLTG